MSAPASWTKGVLGSLCTIEIGGTPSRNTPDYWDTNKDSDNLWVSIRDLSKPLIQSTAEHISDLGTKHSNVKLQQPGTVLLSFKLSIGRVAIAGKPLYTNEAIAGLVSESLSHDFLYQGLQHWDLLQGVDQAIKGATLNKEKLKRIEFTYPSRFDEQSKIAEILLTVDRAIEQTEALIAKQQRIKTGLMQDLLTRGIDENGNLRSGQTHSFKDSPLGRIPEEWEVRTLDDCCERIVVGLASSTTHAYRSSGVPMIRNQNIRKGFFDDREMLYLDPNFARSFPNKATRSGDVLTVRTGSNVGDTATVPERYVGSPTFTTLISSPKTGMLDSRFLVYCVLSDSGQSELNRIMVGGGKENLNVGQFVQFRLRLPPLEEQFRSIEILEATESNIESDRRQLEKYKQLKVALMQDLLTGEKRVTSLLDAEATEDTVHA